MPSLNLDAPVRQSMFDALKGTWTDRLLLCLALISIFTAWFVIQAQIAAGPAMAEIYHGKTLLATYPLPKPGEAAISLQVEGDLGMSEIVIDEHGARIATSPCSSQRCVLSGAHSHAGDMIACVPNRILITLRGSAESKFDAIVE
ncbi:MAG: NusG domain II-containing protein [Mariprofundus sp.]|nr:NusG domain II-containing protein [Mariprofundus sp.]